MEKVITIFFCLVLFGGLLTISSCNNNDESDYVLQGTPINVVQNYDLTISSSQWTYDDLYDRWYYQLTCSANPNSAVYVYVMSESVKQAMPYYVCPEFKCAQYDFATALLASPSYIELQFTNYVSRTSRPAENEYFYLVIVPPTIIMAFPDFDWSNYEKVEATFNIKD
jgi:hypothetical protein